MKKQKTLKALVLTAVLAFGMLLPMTTNAQNDGFFRNLNEDYDNRDGETIITGSGITNQQFGAPLGSGLLVLVAAGAGYVALKKKED